MTSPAGGRATGDVDLGHPSGWEQFSIIIKQRLITINTEGSIYVAPQLSSSRQTGSWPFHWLPSSMSERSDKIQSELLTTSWSEGLDITKSRITRATATLANHQSHES